MLDDGESRPARVTRAVRSQAELLAEIDRLPPSAADRVRVYRGQTREHLIDGTDDPSIAPSISRTNWSARDPDPVWLTAAMQAIRSRVRFSVPDLELRDVWAPALLQHYGARSAFVDVTRDLDVALWFALHTYELRWFSVLSPIVARGWVPDRVALATYRTVDPAHSGSVIYVLDAPRWSSELRVVAGRLTLGAHGTVVEVMHSDGGAALQQAATRLGRQRASLLWCEAKDPAAGSLHQLVVGSFHLAPGFDPTGAPGALAPVEAMFPGPDEDECYRTLLELPPILGFNPEYARHPLDLPLYVSDSLPAAFSSLGDGTTSAPLQLGRLAAMADAPDWNRQVAAFVDLIPHRSPMLMHRELVASRSHDDRITAPLVVDGTSHRLENALPILIESPLWSVTSGVHDSLDRGMWIESALRLGLPESIDGRPTDSVYVELSPLDTRRVGVNAGALEIRGAWVVRRGDHVAVRVFGVTDGNLRSVQARFRWNDASGTLEPVGPPGLPPRPIQNTRAGADLLKSVLVVLAVLRSLGPELKPPAVHSLRAGGGEGRRAIYQPGAVLEPQLGRAEWIAGTPYMRPTALDGSVYAFASGYGGGGDDGLDARQRLKLWSRYVPLVKDPCYAVAAGVPLAQLSAYFEEFDAAVETVRRSRALVEAVDLHAWDDMLDVLEAQLEISRGRTADARRLLRGVATRARGRSNVELATDLETLAAQPRPRIWGEVTELVPGFSEVSPPSASPAVLFR
jgi:hypothetical protein